MISLDEAMARVLAAAGPLPAERTPLEEAAGRYLAAPVIARTSQPRFDASAMDGYAVRAEDAHAGAVLNQIGASQAGEGFAGSVEAGTCVRIFTGAPLPEGADSVVIQENASADGDIIAINQAAVAGQHIRVAGRDFQQDQIVLDAGQFLNPAAVMLAAASNNDYLTATPKPVVSLLATGDELVPAGADLGPDRIVSSNSPGLAALFSPFSHTVDDLGIAPDDEDGLRALLKQALDSEADVLVTTGGASVGDRDLVQPVLKSLGVEMDFWKIAMRPGKPLMFGSFGRTLVFGLPGNPVSAMVTALLVVVPALRALAGAPVPRDIPIMLPLAEPIAANGDREHFLRCVVVPDEEGRLAARPIPETDSAHLTSLAQANGLIRHAPKAPALVPGEMVPVILFPWTRPG